MPRTESANKKSNINTPEVALSNNENLIPISKYYNILIEKFVGVCNKNDIMIFGSYVREYMCGRAFNYEKSDIDIYSDKFSIRKIVSLLVKEGIRVTILEDSVNKYLIDESNEPSFKVSHIKIGLINDLIFIGESIEVDVDFVKDVDMNMYPPFGNLDFTTNALIWDDCGIRLTRNTGTDIDNLSERELKATEQKLLEDAKNKITTYIPLNVNGDIMSSANKYFRQTRIRRITKLLKDHWKIENIPQLQNCEFTSERCAICLDNLKNNSIKMSCCSMHYHYHCFEEHAKTELENRTFVRCTQRCSSFKP